MIHPALMKYLQGNGFYNNSQPIDPELMKRRNFELAMPPQPASASNPQPGFRPGGPPNEHVVDYKDQQIPQFSPQERGPAPQPPQPQQGYPGGQPAGYMDRLLADPQRMGLLRYGLGVLGGERMGEAMDRGMATSGYDPNPPSYETVQDPYGFGGAAQRDKSGKFYNYQRKPTASMRGLTTQQKNYLQAKDDPAFKKFLENTRQSTTPKSIREYKYFKTLDEDGKRDFYRLKRAQPSVNLGGTQMFPDPLNPAAPPIANIPKTLPPEKDPNYLKTAEAEKAAGKAMGEEYAGLPDKLAKTARMIELIDKAVAHPGRTGVTGMPNILTMGGLIPGTKESDYRALADQLKGGVFAEAFQALKGGGHITEVEGEKATQAEARLNEAQSDEAYVEALMELQLYIKIGIGRAMRKAGVAPIAEDVTLEDLEAERKRRRNQ